VSTKKAVLLMAFGTPYQAEDILPYYTHIRRGHAPSPALVADLTKRYQAIGGLSPLRQITLDQVQSVADILTDDYNGQVPVFLGLRHTEPFIEDVIEAIQEQGFDEIYGLPLAAQFSTFSSNDYHHAAEVALEAYPQIIYHAINGFWDETDLLDFWASQIRDLKALTDLSTTKVIFSAHSLPMQTITAGDPYLAEVKANAQQIAKMAELQATQFTLGWQSAGRTKDPWIGPSFIDVAEDLIQHQNITTIISAPIGFINNNLEINYDVDIQLRQVIEKLGGTLQRLEMPNNSEALTNAIVSKLEAAMA
jgi:ferrochelatase